MFEKNKKITAVGLENPLPLVEMKMNKGINSAVTTPKTSSKPKVVEALKKTS